MSVPVSPAAVLRLAQAVPETAENLVEITKDTK